MSRNTIIVIIIGLILLGAAGYMFFGKPSTESAVTAVPGTSEAEATFLTLTAQIDPVAFDIGILSDPRFIGLRDIRTAIVPEATGKTDPFAPLPTGR